jgi:hypothetical protein
MFCYISLQAATQAYVYRRRKEAADLGVQESDAVPTPGHPASVVRRLRNHVRRRYVTDFFYPK